MTWTKEEEKYLKENFKTMFYSDIAKKINKSSKAVSNKACRSKLRSGGRTRITNRDGENNNNWKNGISKNYYHYKTIQIERYPKKERAKGMVRDALKSGRLHKPNNCSKCKKIFRKEKIEGHHEDYDKPLEVIWLCRSCHLRVHKK